MSGATRGRARAALRGLALSIALLWPAVATAQTTGEATSPRTLIEALDVRSPEAMLDTFIEAYARSDYFKVHYLLSAEAKAGFRETISAHFSLKPLFPKVEGMDLPGSKMAVQKTATSATTSFPMPPSISMT